MNIKKLVSTALIAALLLLAVGCVPQQVAPTKAEGEITVFADESLKDLLMAASKAYTKPVREKPEREKIIMLFTFCTAEELSQKVAGDEYVDVIFTATDETLDAFDAAANGHDKLVHSSRTTLTRADGSLVYAAGILNQSDRQSVAEGFLGFIASEEAAPLLAELGAK